MTIPVQEKGSMWTEQQWQAIHARQKQILVAAAAGSGKTAVLVERMISLVLDRNQPIDIDRLLIVTFTSAAAAEMRSRISQALEKAMSADPQSKHIKRQLALVNKAAISTIHSFCLDVIRKYYYMIDLDPSFRLLDETEGELMRDSVIEEVLESYYTQGDPVFFCVVDTFGGDRSDDPLKKLLLKCYHFARSHPFPWQWLRHMTSLNREASDQLPEAILSLWVSELLEEADLRLRGVYHRLQRAKQIIDQPAGPEPYAENINMDMEMIEHLLSAQQHSWNALVQAFEGVSFSRLKACKGEEFDPVLQEQVKSIRQQVKDQIQRMQEEWFSRSLEQYTADIETMRPLLVVLGEVIVDFDNAYSKVKRQKSVLDFADLEHFALRILQAKNEDEAEGVPWMSMDTEELLSKLQPSQAAIDYQHYLVEILIDEYQDTNLVQECMLRLIGNSRLFMVGDVKQSIYRFRLADPSLFMSKYRSFPTSHHLKQNDSSIRIDLSRNFRSRPEILNATNYLFKQIMDVRVGELAYDQDAELKLGAAYPDNEQMAAEWVLLDRDFTREEDEQSQSQDQQTSNEEVETARLEARAIAQIMHRLKQSGYVYEVKTEKSRPVQYRDMVILLRSASNWAPAFLEEFRQQGIPAYTDTGGGYFDQAEVAVMLSLLQVIDNPVQDIPLVSVLRSPLVGLDEEQLAYIRLYAPDSTYYDALCSYMNDKHIPVAEETQQVIKRFWEQVGEWRTQARQGSLAQLIWDIYRQTGYDDFVGAMPGGQQRKANLRALYDRARQYESTSFRGLFRFLRFVDRMREKGQDLSSARALGEEEDVVRIMTIHKSKGLEFPYVFVAGLGKTFNFRDIYAATLLHKQLGIGVKYTDPDKRVSYPSLPQLAIKRKMVSEMLAEEMRILYVALTRAREKLYLIATIKDLHTHSSRWQQSSNAEEWLLPADQRAGARSYLDWLGPALIRHRQIRKDLNDAMAEEGTDKGHLDVWNHPSRWKLKVIDAADLVEAVHDGLEDEQDKIRAIAQFQQVSLDDDGLDIQQIERMKERLNWHYPYEQAEQLRAKQSVTEMKRHFERNLQEETSVSHYPVPMTDKPRFLQQETLQSNERGTAMHTVMQHFQFHQLLDVQAVEQQLENMLHRQLLNEQERQVIDAQDVLTFVMSELGQRICGASRLEREIAFTLSVPIDDMYPESVSAEKQAGHDEGVIIQGVVDCLVEDEHGLMILDYKTDAILNRFDGGFDEARPVLIKRYETQLAFYKQAVEAIWRKPVTEVYIYFFDGAHVIDLSEDI